MKYERKPVKINPDYSVDTEGVVWSHKGGFTNPLKPFPVNRYGHLAVDLGFGSTKARKVILVHRLVLEAFVGPCPEGMEACHYPDPDPANNRADNLRWDTPTRNNQDKKERGAKKLNPIAVAVIKEGLRKGKKQLHLADFFDVHMSIIWAIKVRRIWTWVK